MGLLPFRGTLTGWRTRQRETSWSSTKGSAKYCTWGGITPDTSRNCRPSGWKAGFQRRTWVFWWSIP